MNVGPRSKEDKLPLLAFFSFAVVFQYMKAEGSCLMQWLCVVACMKDRKSCHLNGPIS